MADQADKLSPEQLRHEPAPSMFDFRSTEELEPLEIIIGQERALRSISFGVNIRSQGYHMYALGPVGTGKKTIIKKFLATDAESKSVPDDWLYVNNFSDSDNPKALRLPAGTGRELRDDLDRLVRELQTEVPKAFESSAYEQQLQESKNRLNQKSQELFENLEQKVKEAGFRLLQGPDGIGIIPVMGGEPVTQDQMKELDEATRQEFEKNGKILEEEIKNTMRRAQELQKEARKEVMEIDRKVVRQTIDHILNELKEKYADFDKVVAFLDAARANLLKDVTPFKHLKKIEEVPPEQRQFMSMMQEQVTFDEFRGNLIIDNSTTKGAPIVFEKNPTSANLLGRVEYQGKFGALVTNFRMIKSGALHKANGGYLLLDAFELLTKPMAWEILKRALKNQEVVIESLEKAFGFMTTRTLEPEPIPLDIKVIVMGDPYLYYLLYNLDPDFPKLFKVKADFGSWTPWTDESARQYAQFIANLCREEKLNHFTPDGVSSIIGYSARLVSHQKKLITVFGLLADIIREASFWAEENNRSLVTAADVARAIDEKIYRSNRIEKTIQDMIEEETILIDTRDAVVGQVNGISVLSLGDYSFGKPSRITARTFVGSKGILSIDRETELGGPIHNKGSLILAGYLGGKYAGDVPLAFSASITFEQLYEGVEGDSASSTELYALLSSLSGLPIRQDLAVTGSVNQRGEVQAIGGVNEKIEGFFAVCKAKGFTGTQGVLIPASNVKHLMLRHEIVEEVRNGRFHIYAVATIDQGISLLTGTEAGKQQEDGTYPEGTVNHAVQLKILELAGKFRWYSSSSDEEAGAENQGE
ncbi:MAG: ATP-binding protein [Desulfobulbaceae bacterium]|jgi:lon-related putative ATP-dependent protease|nr:ATP-binding protein [Desulfobulbaceae bacterium]MDY0351679.1 ATP-binding protein [Desulfobulbaceae bacterium]